MRSRRCAGIDPLTGKRHYLTRTIPAGPDAAERAKATRTRLINQVNERCRGVDPEGYEGYIRNHIRPLLGELAVGTLDGETLDSFYTILRTCRAHCAGRPLIEHRSPDEHECDERCTRHVCKPLATSSIRQVHGHQAAHSPGAPPGGRASDLPWVLSPARIRVGGVAVECGRAWR